MRTLHVEIWLNDLPGEKVPSETYVWQVLAQRQPMQIRGDTHGTAATPNEAYANAYLSQAELLKAEIDATAVDIHNKSKLYDQYRSIASLLIESGKAN